VTGGVADLSDQLLEHVLQRNHAKRPAAVDHPGQVPPVRCSGASTSCSGMPTLRRIGRD